MTGQYSKGTLAIPAETTDRFFPFFTKLKWAIIHQICLIYQVDIDNL